jgi:uncharacterized LabA/DUF88 family protein
MRVSIFFDGQDFYRSLQRFDETLRVDYDRLARWIVEAAGGASATFAGAYYYVGVAADAPAQVAGFLRGLELRPGYFVKREPHEKRVDTRLVADLVHYAANDAYDAAVLVSGDGDFVPAVEAVNALGKQAWVATWSAEELAPDLRVRCFSQIRLADGLDRFRASLAPRSPARPAHRSEPRAGDGALERALAELQRAEARLPHVSRGYFVSRWKSQALPTAGPEREALVRELVAAGLAEEVEIAGPDGRRVVALRSQQPRQ